MTEEDTTNVVPVGDDWFDNWLSTGTVAQRSVDVYGRPDLMGEYDQLKRRFDTAEQREKGGVEISNAEQRESTQLLEEMERLYNLWVDSKTTWFLRALSIEETREIDKEADHLKDPGEKASDEEKKAYRDEVDRVNELTDLMAIQKALVRVENQRGDVVMESITIERLRALRDKVGMLQVSRLVQASMVASSQEPNMPVPLSRSNSKSDRS